MKQREDLSDDENFSAYNDILSSIGSLKNLQSTASEERVLNMENMYYRSNITGMQKR